MSNARVFAIGFVAFGFLVLVLSFIADAKYSGILGMAAEAMGCLKAGVATVCFFGDRNR